MSNDLDRLMAEKCMAWEETLLSSFDEISGTSESVPCWKEKESSKITRTVDLWTPTTDIAQAMMCAEKMTQSVTEIALMWASYDRIEHKWSCQIRIDEDREWGHAKTPALAICKAIAAALKGTENQD